MRHAAFAALLVASALALPGHAQEQQAGNAASANAEETFQKLVEQCDDTDALVLRARIRLLLGRTTEEAAAQAKTMMDDGLARCGEGDIEAAKSLMTEALAIADAGATEKFGQDATLEVAKKKAETESAAAPGPAEKEDKPWWKVW